MSARKIGFLILILLFGAVVETSWNVRENSWSFGPEGCRVLGGRFYGPSFSFEETTVRELAPKPSPEEGEASPAPEVEITNAFGGVKVVPGEGPSVRVTLRKVIFQPTEAKARAFAEGVELRLQHEEGRLRVSTNRDDVARKNVGFETHLELEVPPQTRAVIRSDHGPIEVSGIASAEVRATFDDVRVEKIAGPVRIDARQGSVEIADLGAELTLKQRHGEAEVTGVAGKVDVDLQHGKLKVRRVAGLEAKVAFAEVVVAEIEGNVVLDARRTSVEASDVTGDLEAETSFNDIRIERIGGDVRARVDRGGVVAEDVEGSLTAEATHQDVQLDRIQGPVEVTVRHGGLTASELGGGARVRAWEDDVSITGSHGPIAVEVERGDIVLAPGTPITQDLSASAKGGGIRLEVPAGSRFELEAESHEGDLHLDVPGLEVTESGSPPRHGARGTIGGGGARVKLDASGDITLEAGSSDTPAEMP